MKQGTLQTKTSKGVFPRIEPHERNYQDIFDNKRDLLDLPYDELEQLNVEVKKERLGSKSMEEFRDRFVKYIEEEKRVKAVIICFTDMEGRFQMLDYDKSFFLGSYDNLTFDGSSIKGFTRQSESDLRLKIDWGAFRWLPADIFGAGKVLFFANVCDQQGEPYDGDFRSVLAKYSAKLTKKRGLTAHIAPEIEGFLLQDINAEQFFEGTKGFKLPTMSGYFNCLPQDTLKLFIDKLAGVQRALGFENEKDHPEVAPAQFELCFKYSAALEAADQIQLYKLTARQVAKFLGLTASFLPKPIQNINGSGMHTNISLSQEGKNIFYDTNGQSRLSKTAHKFLTGILHYAKDLCLVMSSSVNAYRRLDPHFEAPNEIKFSAVDRGSMIRIPVGNERSARVEVRTVAPDASPYLLCYCLLRAGLAGVDSSDTDFKKWEKVVYTGGVKKLPSNIYIAMDSFSRSKFMMDIMGKENHSKYLELKRAAADRSPKELGTTVKTNEIIYHHEITNQKIWAGF